MMSRPPQHKYSATTVRTTARLRFDKDLKINYVDNNAFDIYSLLSKTMWKGVVKQFDEIKVTRINVWVDSNINSTVGGRIGVALVPDHTSIHTTGFTTAMDLMNSMVKKPSQTVYTSFTPSEPSDREWYSTSSADTDKSDKVYTILVGTDMIKPDNTVKGESFKIQMTIDVSFKLRGLTGIATVASKPNAAKSIWLKVPTIASKDVPVEEGEIEDYQMI